MITHHPITLAGVELWLLPDKAVYWPEAQALLVADVHIGKAAAYRRLGQPVPHGTTEQNLARLGRLIDDCAARRLIVLGDFLHAPEARTPATLQQLADWRHARSDLAITLIRGNHDHRAGDPPASLRIEVVSEPLLLGPFALQHEPTPCPGRMVLAGHLHPAYRLRGRGRQSVRLPCFCFDRDVALLPAFGEFTGAMNVEEAPDRRLFLIADGRVWPLGSGASQA